MSNNSNEDTLPFPPDDAAPAKRKPAAKKTAVKKVAAKTVAKKAAAKKVVSKKATPEVLPTPEIPADVPAAKVPRPRKVASKITTPDATQTELPGTAQEAKAPSRYGRVPGGGPTVPREPSAPQEEISPAPPREAEASQQVHTENAPQNQPSTQQGAPTESRSKRRREKRKRRNSERNEQGGQQPQPQNRQGGKQGYQRPDQRPRQEGGNSRHQSHHSNRSGHPNDSEDRRPAQLDGPKIETNGMLELAPKGFGFLRVPQKNFEQARDDVFVAPEIIRKYNLRLGQWIHGLYQNGPRGPQLMEITTINDLTPEECAKLPHFDELKAINPTRRISFETTPERFTTRVIDIMAPVGRGQRGLIVSPPRSGKTTLLLHMAEAIREKYDEAIHLMVVLVDERPEEVTEFRRALPGTEIYASSNDEQARNHCRIAELAIERAKRLVEAGKDVFLLMDSITRLARAYNGNMNNRGRGTGSGGITIGALEIPRRLFAAARNTRGGGSLTILATALIQTNSRADEAIFMEFKGTGNMELVLDRKIAENYIYPAVDIFKSGTRREELLLADHMLHKIHLIRRGLAGHRPAEAMERLLFFLKKFPNNPQMLLEIKG